MTGQTTEPPLFDDRSTNKFLRYAMTLVTFFSRFHTRSILREHLISVERHFLMIVSKNKTTTIVDHRFLRDFVVWIRENEDAKREKPNPRRLKWVNPQIQPSATPGGTVSCGSGVGGGDTRGRPAAFVQSTPLLDEKCRHQNPHEIRTKLTMRPKRHRTTLARSNRRTAKLHFC